MTNKQIQELLKYAELDVQNKRKAIELTVELFSKYEYHLDERVLRTLETFLLDKLLWYKNNTKIETRSIITVAHTLTYLGGGNE